MSELIQIFTCYHKKYDMADSNVIIPIHVGRAQAKVKLDMLGDDEGENISQKNPHYCELTALYWAWKNSTADIIGLFHYRRFLNFRTQATHCYKIHGKCKKFGIDKEHVLSLLAKNDVLLPHKSTFNLSLYDQYAQCHINTDLDLTLKIIQKDWPEFYPVAQKVFSQPFGYFTNMFIARKKFVHEYCQWLFDILFKVEFQIHQEILTRDTYQQRVYGFLSERLFNVYIEYKKEKGIKILELPTLFIDDSRHIFEKHIYTNKTKYSFCKIKFFKIIHKPNKNIYYLFGIPIYQRLHNYPQNG